LRFADQFAAFSKGRKACRYLDNCLR